MSRKNDFLVFVVDNNSSYRKVIIGCLQAIGLSRFQAFDCGEQCFAEEKSKANLVILDYNLGDGNWNGIEFMEEYRRKHSESNFLFMSSNTNVDIAVESIRLGALDYILKSKIGLTRLIQRVEKVKDYYNQKRLKKRNWNLLLLVLLICTAFTVAVSIAYIVI